VPSTPQNGNNKDLLDGYHVRFYCYGKCSNERGSSHDIATGSGTVEDEETAPSTIVDWSATGDDIGISVVQMEPPDPQNTDAQLTTLNGTDDDVIDTSQCTAQAESCQRMEVTEPQGDFPTCHDGESHSLTIKSKCASLVRRREEAEANCEEVEGAMADKDDTPPHRERERTPD